MQNEDSDAEEEEGMDREVIAKQLFDGDDVSAFQILFTFAIFSIRSNDLCIFFITCANNLVLVCQFPNLYVLTLIPHLLIQNFLSKFCIIFTHSNHKIKINKTKIDNNSGRCN